MTRTRTDPNLVESPLDDEPMQFREWGTTKVYPLPSPYTGDRTVGSSPDAWLQLQDPHQFVSRNHALLRYVNQRWSIVDTGSKNGLWIDGHRSSASELAPGIEVGLGRVRLIVESPRAIAQRDLLSRFLGWAPDRQVVVDRALRQIRGYVASEMPLWITGDDDLVAIARLIHRSFVGEQPFVVADVDDTKSRLGLARAAARGGTLCLRSEKPVRDLPLVRALAFDHEPSARLVVCATTAAHVQPIEIPALATRVDEVARIIDAYARDAIARLGAHATSYTTVDRASIASWNNQTLAGIEESVLRMIAIREFGGVTGAAPHLGVTHSSLSRWLARRTTRSRNRS
ncbi:MAG: FHA domain-containing protein [Kofleriaceae bacterium]